uniref:DNA polymerase n=1 Tax=Leucosporidium scottii TaxID=5278 RepID=A0A0H5GA06_9BASI|nr:hypothetical protein ls5930a1_00183 [Leucosporidium scottii]
MRPDAPVSLKLAYRRIITSMPRLSLKSRTKASLLAELDLEVARLRAWSARVGSRQLESWTAKKMVLPSATGLVVDEREAPKLQSRRRPQQHESTSTTAGGAALGRISPLGIVRSASYLTCLQPPLLPPPQRLLSTSAQRATASADRSSATGSVQQHSRVIEARTTFLKERISADASIDLEKVMADLRDLELLEKLRKRTVKTTTGFKDASRCLYPLWHEVDQGKKSTVTFAELQAALPPIYSIPWTHISERLLLGTNHKLDKLSEKEKAALLFLRVFNVGASRAASFVAAGARSLEDLEPLARQKKISLVRAHKIGLRHFDDIERLIPRSEMEAFEVALKTALRKADPLLECEVLGSYRRRASFSSDIDLVVRHKSFITKDDEETAAPLMRRIVEALDGEHLLDDENRLMYGSKKYALTPFLCRDWLAYPATSIIAESTFVSLPTIHTRSGDALLMKLLRHAAKKRGLCLNEYGLGEKNPNGFKPGTLRLVKDEREIFDLLGFPYLTPEERDYAVWRRRYERADSKT